MLMIRELILDTAEIYSNYNYIKEALKELKEKIISFLQKHMLILRKWLKKV